MTTPRNSRRIRAAYEFMKAHRREFSIETMCRVLGVSRSSFYEWLRNPQSNRAKEDERLVRLIRASYKASHGATAHRVFFSIYVKQVRHAASTAFQD